MTGNAWLQIAVYLAVLIALVKPLGAYMARVFDRRARGAERLVGWLERGIYRLAGIDPTQQMSWTTYAGAMLWFNGAGFLAVYLLQRCQMLLPLNPQQLPAVAPDLAFNTAVSFATNTNWQSYGGETTMGHLVQMLGLAVQNFLSAATGIAVLVALVRAFRDRRASTDEPRKQERFATIGSFWFDVTRSTLYILLPLSLALALVLVAQGVPQNFSATKAMMPIERSGTSGSVAVQNVPLGPVASQIAIKQLGTNGGGYFNVNSAHPFENPTPLSDFLECLAILLIPAALCYTLGELVGDRRQGWAVLAAMLLIFVPLLLFCTYSEQQANPQLASLEIDFAPTAHAPGGNMEGKEQRFGIARSALWAVATTAASNGSINSMHDSYTPLGGLVPMWLIQLGEVVFGGVGSGLYGMLVFLLIAVFVAGLMVGRTPEYLGKKIEAFEMKMASLVILLPPLVVLVGAALGVATAAGKAGIFNPGAHGLSEVLYAFSSAGNNNGSAFAGLGANTLFYNTALGLAMLVARYWLAIPVLAIAGSLAAKKSVPPGHGTLPTHEPLFVVLLAGIVILVGALTFVPVLALGPIVEHLEMIRF